MGVIRSNNLIRPQIQSSDKGGPKLGEEVKRTSQESHVSADRLSAGQAADSLVDNCLKNGGGQIFSGSASLIRGWMSDLANTPQRAAIG